MAVNQMNGTEKNETPVNVLQDENASLLALVRERDATMKLLHTTIQHQSAALASMSAQMMSAQTMPVEAPGVNTDALEATIVRLEKELETVQAAHEKKVADLEQSLEHTTQEFDNKNLELVQMEVDQAKACDTLTKQLEEAQHAHEKAQNAVADLRATVTNLEEQLDTSKEAREALGEEVEGLRAQLKDTKTGLENAHKEDIADMKNELKDTKKKLKDTKTELGTVQNAHKEEVDKLTANFRASEEELESLRAEHNKATAGLNKQPKVEQATQTTNVAASSPAPPPTPPAPPAEADRKQMMVKVTPPLEKSDVDQINQMLAKVQDGKTFAEKYLVTADFSPLTFAIIAQKEGGDTENLQKATESLMKLLIKGGYTCIPSSLMSAERKNLANMMQSSGMNAQQWEKQLQQEMDNKKAQIDKKKAEKTQEPLDKAHLDECCTRAKWHYHCAVDGVVFSVDAESIIGKCGFDSSLEVDEHLAGPFAGTRGRNLMLEIAWPNNVYCHLMDGHTKGRKKRLLVYGTDINRNEAMAAAKALLKRVTAAAAAANTHASNTVGDHAAHALGQ